MYANVVCSLLNCWVYGGYNSVQPKPNGAKNQFVTREDNIVVKPSKSWDKHGLQQELGNKCRAGPKSMGKDMSS